MKSSSARSKAKRAPAAPSAAAPDTLPGPEVLRRGVLALATGLIVARPQVLGEDPGLLNPTSDLFNLLLTLLWLVTALAFTVWRAWSGQGGWYGSLVEVGLFGVVLLMFVGAAGPASYKHPAWLIAWEWLALLLAFCLVRQLAVTPAEQQCLLAAVLATGIGLSVYGIHQYHVELPRLRAEYLKEPGPPPLEKQLGHVATVATVPGVPFPANVPLWAMALSSQPAPLTPLQAMLARQGVYLEADDPQIETWAKRIEMNHAFSRFAHPNSFAGYLALLLPAAAGCAFVSWRGGRPRSLTVLTAVGVLVMAYALWLTHSRGAILGLLLAAALAAGLYGRQFLREWRRIIVAAVGLVVLAAGAYLVLRGGAFGKDTGTAAARLEYWSATWKMIQEHPLLGVGPGNFSRWYPRYMAPSAAEHITDPHNFLLELWSTAGFFALAALLVALGAFFWRVASLFRRAGGIHLPSGGRKPPEGPQGAYAPRSERVYWEFYLGGMVGLLLAFLAWTPGKPKDEIIQEGTAAGVMAAIWFASFALLEKIRWTGPGRVLALAAGVTALLFNLCVSGGIGFPSVALMLWVMAALALNALPQAPQERFGRHWLGRVAPVPVALAVVLVYLTDFFNPVTEAAKYARLAQHDTLLLMGVPEDPTAEPGKRPRRDVNIVRDILPAWEKAIEADPRNAAYHLQAATWYGETWKLHPLGNRLFLEAVGHALVVHGPTQKRDRSAALDPENKEGFLTGYRLQRMYADWKGSLRDDPKQPVERAVEQQHHYWNAADLLRAAVVRDPTEARLHFQLAETLFLLEKTSREVNRQADQAAREKEKEAAQLAQLTDPVSAESRRQALKSVQEMQALARQMTAEADAAAREARQQAQTAQELDAAAPTRARKLTEPQREQVRQWLKAASPS